LQQVILIGVMSLPNSAVYLQFHPMIYLVKLHIEMNIADLIARVVRASNPHQGGSDSNSHSNRLESSHKMTTLVNTRIKKGSLAQTAKESEADMYSLPHGGIKRTIETLVICEPKDGEDDNQSESSSTRELQKHFNIV
jgi:hypothetical protein